MSRLAVVGLTLSVMFAGVALAKPKVTYDQPSNTPVPAWRVKVDRAPQWMRWTSARLLLVGDDTRIVALEEATGGEKWRREGLSEPVIRFSADATVVRVADGPAKSRRLFWIDAATGRDVTDSTTIRAVEAGILDVDVPRLVDSDSTRVIRRGDGAVQVRLDSGAMLWESPALAPAARMSCVASGDATPIERERIDERPMLPRVPFLLSRDGARVYVTNGNTIFALKRSNGQPEWTDTQELCGRPVEIVETAHGLLVRTMPEMRGNDELLMLTPDTGRPVWRYPGKGMGSMTTTDLELGNLLVEGASVLLLAGRQLVRVELATGRVRAMEKVWIEEHDRHIRLERLGPSLVLSAGQEIEWLDVTGRRVRQMEVEPPLNQREALTGARFPRGYPDTVAFLLAATDPTEVMTGPLLLGISKTNGHILRRIPAPAKPLFEFHPQGPVFVADTKTVSAFVP